VATLSYLQLRALWISAGGSDQTADVAAAVALAESGGCQYALSGPVDVRPVKECSYRATSSENSFGLWQINTLAHLQYAGTNLFDPRINAGAALQISGNGSDWTPWTTYTSGAYRAYLQGPPAPAPSPGNVGTGVATPGRSGPYVQNQPDATDVPDIAPDVWMAWGVFTHGLGKVLPHHITRAKDSTARLVRAVR